ncbi:MAG: SPOR domain-containing protein [Candidatus Neomarinimicrobiota bacterium]
MKNRLKLVSLLLLLVALGCQRGKDVKTIFVGEPETIIVEPPEDAFDVSYRWEIVDHPVESALVPDFSSYSNVFTFTPDVTGDYVFAVTVVSYGDEVSDYKFYFDAMEDTSVVRRVEPAAARDDETRAPAAAVDEEPATTPESPPRMPPAPPRARPRPSVTKAAAPNKIFRSNVVAGHFTVQVSSWKTAKQAQRIMQQVAQESGYDAYIQRVLLEDRDETWWRVRVGDFTSLEEAKVLQDKIMVTYPGAWVDNLRKEDIDPQP